MTSLHNVISLIQEKLFFCGSQPTPQDIFMSLVVCFTIGKLIENLFPIIWPLYLILIITVLTGASSGWYDDIAETIEDLTYRMLNQ